MAKKDSEFFGFSEGRKVRIEAPLCARLKNRRVIVSRSLDGKTYFLWFKRLLSGRNIKRVELTLTSEAMAALVALVLKIENCQIFAGRSKKP